MQMQNEVKMFLAKREINELTIVRKWFSCERGLVVSAKSKADVVAPNGAGLCKDVFKVYETEASGVLKIKLASRSPILGNFLITFFS